MDGADTLFNDVVPILQRDFQLRKGSQASTPQVNQEVIRVVLSKKLPKVFSTHAISHLQGNSKVLFYLLKKLWDALPNATAKSMAEHHAKTFSVGLIKKLAENMGINRSHWPRFASEIIAPLQRSTQALYRQRLNQPDLMGSLDQFIAFVIDNMFIDEFENTNYIRTHTDKHNRAILPPKAKPVAQTLIKVWVCRLGAETTQ